MYCCFLSENKNYSSKLISKNSSGDKKYSVKIRQILHVYCGHFTVFQEGIYTKYDETPRHFDRPYIQLFVNRCITYRTFQRIICPTYISRFVHYSTVMSNQNKIQHIQYLHTHTHYWQFLTLFFTCLLYIDHIKKLNSTLPLTDW